MVETRLFKQMDKNTTILTLIRHGETEWNRDGIHQGQLDSPLSNRGLQQAHALAKYLAGSFHRYDILYSSDLGRAAKTAEVIGKELSLKINLDGRLRERKLGIMEGLTMKEFKQMYHEEYEKFLSGDPDYVIPKGESVRQRSRRAVSCLDEIVARHEYRDILVIAHGGILDSIFRKVFGIPLAVKRNFSLINTSINTFSVRDGRWKLETWGSLFHMEEINAVDDFI